LSVTPFEKIQLLQLLTDLHVDQKQGASANQLILL
jgi:hypothetical protein